MQLDPERPHKLRLGVGEPTAPRRRCAQDARKEEALADVPAPGWLIRWRFRLMSEVSAEAGGGRSPRSRTPLARKPAARCAPGSRRPQARSATASTRPT